MKEIFADFYNKIVDFFTKADEKDKTKDVARNRLKLVLMQDRTNLTPRILEQMRSELIDLLSRYVELDKELLELNFEQEGDQVALMLSIPVIRAKDEEEIEKALAEAAEKKAETASTENEEEEEEDNEETETPEDIEGEEKIESEESDEIEAVEDSENSEEITESEIAENISSETEKSDYNDNSEIKSKKSRGDNKLTRVVRGHLL